MKKIKRQLEKIKWFMKNHRRIDKGTVLLSNSALPEYNSDGLIVFNSCECLDELGFMHAYERSLTVNDWRGPAGMDYDMRWRYYIVCWAADHVKKLQGDFVECGVYKGGYSLAVMDYLNFPALNKKFWLFDTYEGLSFDHLTTKEKAAGLFKEYSHYENCYDWVLNIFKDLPAIIIKGTVPETLGQYKGNDVAYLSIDMNCVEPEIAAANYFWEKIVPGGVIILDDYGFKVHIEQKKAFDKFALERNVRILQLPTGQGLIFKP